MTRKNIRGITYPSDQEDNGTVLLGWQGPSSVDDYYQSVYLVQLLHY